MTSVKTTTPGATTPLTPATPAVKANQGSPTVDDVKNSLTLAGTPEEKRQLLRNVVDQYRNNPNKDETKTNFMDLIDAALDDDITPAGRKELEKMLGINLDTLKG